MMIISTTTTSWKATVISIYIYIYIILPKDFHRFAGLYQGKQTILNTYYRFFFCQNRSPWNIYIYSTWQTVHLESDLKKLHI
jgi:hypothetical protein